ncbi:hypothetical protein D3C87_1750790 [compost metagenome]
MHIDAIQQGAGEFVAIALHHVWRAGATTAGFAEKTAGARIHRRDQLKARRKTHAILRAGNHDMAGFQGFPQHFQHFALELRKFIKKQHSVMGERDFAGLRFRAAVGL